jgi:hypothetical protein
VAEALVAKLKAAKGELAGLSVDSIMQQMGRMAEQRAAEAALNNVLDGTKATMSEVWESVLFQRIRQQILDADSAGQVDESKRLLVEALGIARNAALNLGISQRISQRDILANVFPPERMQEYYDRMAAAAQRAPEPEATRPNTMDRVAAENAEALRQTDNEDDVVRPTTMDRVAAENANEMGQAEDVEEVVRPATMDRVDAENADVPRQAEDVERQRPPAGQARPRAGLLAHVTDIERFKKFKKMFRQVAQLAADQDPKLMVKANALVKTLIEYNKVLKEGATAEELIEFCVQQAGPQTRTARPENNQHRDEPAQDERPFRLSAAIRENREFAGDFRNIVTMYGTDPGRAEQMALALARKIIEAHGLNIDPKTLAEEILKLIRKPVAKPTKTGSKKPRDDQDNPGAGAAGGRPKRDQKQTKFTKDHVTQTKWDEVSEVYFGDKEYAAEMEKMALAMVKKGEKDKAVSTSARSLLAKSKKAKGGKFKSIGHVVGAVSDALFKRVSGKKVTKAIKASDIPKDEDGNKAA